jgi:prolyl-tRNA synthetase
VDDFNPGDLRYVFHSNGPSDVDMAQLFRFKDRKNAEYLLSPTHEEEITTLVSSSVKSYKELPVRLHQTCMNE